MLDFRVQEIEVSELVGWISMGTEVNQGTKFGLEDSIPGFELLRRGARFDLALRLS